MPSLYYGMIKGAGVPADEDTVRSAIVYERDAPAAMQPHQPSMSEVETDPNPHLGLDPRQLASYWVQGQEGTDPNTLMRADSTASSFDVIDNQVASSGFAAHQEAAGKSNPNLSYAVGIEPVRDLSEGGKFGNEYFVRHDRDVQETMGNYMTVPPGYDSPGVRGVAQQAYQERTREAANPYAEWWTNFSG